MILTLSCDHKIFKSMYDTFRDSVKILKIGNQFNYLIYRSL